MKKFIVTVEIEIDYCSDEECAEMAAMHVVWSNEAKVVGVREVQQ